MVTKRKTQHQDDESKPAAAGSGAGNLNGSQLAPGASSDAQLQDQLRMLNSGGVANTNIPAQAYARGAAPQADQHGAPAPAHGFANGAVSSAPDALATIAGSDEAHIHPDLRGRTSYPSPIPSTMPAPVQPQPQQHVQQHVQPVQPATPSAARTGSPGTGATSPSALLPPSMPGQEPDIPEDTPMPDSAPPIDGRRVVKRELSQSKRAAQNRAAQRAFRQRKEGYIKKLEQQVRDYNDMEANYKQLQSDNYNIRQYALHLHAVLAEAGIDAPPPPPATAPVVSSVTHSADGSQEPQPAGPAGPATHPVPEATQQQQQQQQQPQPQPQQPSPVQHGLPAPAGPPAHVPEAPAKAAAATRSGNLDAVAQAVAGLAAQEQLAERQQYSSKEFSPEGAKQDRHEDEEMQAQLQQEAHATAPTAAM